MYVAFTNMKIFFSSNRLWIRYRPIRSVIVWKLLLRTYTHYSTISGFRTQSWSGRGFICTWKVPGRKYENTDMVCGLNFCSFVSQCPDNDTSSQDLINMISRHADKRSSIITDYWRGYSGMEPWLIIHSILCIVW